jgi:hypothetical protein
LDFLIYESLCSINRIAYVILCLRLEDLTNGWRFGISNSEFAQKHICFVTTTFQLVFRITHQEIQWNLGLIKLNETHQLLTYADDVKVNTLIKLILHVKTQKLYAIRVVDPKANSIKTMSLGTP